MTVPLLPSSPMSPTLGLPSVGTGVESAAPLFGQPVLTPPVFPLPTKTPLPSKVGEPSTKGVEATPSARVAPVELLPLETTRIWGCDFARVDMHDILERADAVIRARQPKYFITANLNYIMLSHERPSLAPINRDADAIIADGHPIVARSRFTSNPLPCRVTGSDMIIDLARMAAQKGYRIFFLGGAPGVATRAAAKLHQMFPDLQIAGCVAPPFRPLTEEEHDELSNRIRQSRTDILLVAFGQPKGELWIYQNYKQLQVPLSIQLGASFDFLAGTAKRAPRMWQRLYCEWLYRALSEPRRLAPRYLANAWFLAKALLSDLHDLIR